MPPTSNYLNLENYKRIGGHFMGETAKREKKEIIIAENRSFEGIWIPKRLYITNKFNLRTKFFIVEIKSLSKNGCCFATDKHFSKFLGVSDRMVQIMIKQLKDDGYLTTEYEYEKDTRAIKKRFLILTQKFLDEFYNEEEVKPTEKDFNTPTEENFGETTEINFNTGTEKNCGEKYNIKSSNTYLSNINTLSVERAESVPKKQKNSQIKAERMKKAKELFEKLWALYPLKKGKGQVSDKQKSKLLTIGYEELERAISRYIQYVDSVDYLHYKNGSTFFNSGYIDYLDANYVPEKEKKKEKKNTFQNFPQRNYDYEELERKLLLS